MSDVIKILTEMIFAALQIARKKVSLHFLTDEQN
jgi:hypothetical protein